MVLNLTNKIFVLQKIRKDLMIFQTQNYIIKLMLSKRSLRLE